MNHRWILALIGSAVIAVGCGSSGGSGRSAAMSAAGSIVFPPAPATPVIEWIGAIHERSDVGGGGGLWKRALVGEEDREPSLRAPTAIAIGPDETFYVVDQQLRGVVVINRAMKRFELFRGASPGTLREPVGVAVDDDGSLYVSDARSQAVYVYDSQLRFIMAIGDRDLFGRPTSLALSADGARLAVCDTERHLVHVIDAGSGGLVVSHGDREHGDREGEFNFPVAAAFDEEGYLYVSDYLNFRIQVFDPSGDLDLVFGTGGDRPGDLNRPRGLAADAANGVQIPGSAVVTGQSHPKLLSRCGRGHMCTASPVHTWNSYGYCC